MASDDSAGIRIHRDGRRYRAVFAGSVVADSVEAVLLCERGHHPVIYFPPAAVAVGRLQASATRSHCPRKGEAGYWNLVIGERRADDAVWSYRQPLPAAAAIAGHYAFLWGALDSVWHEEQQLLAHPRNPFVRIDTLETARRVVVRAGGQVLADSGRAVLLFETGLPVRYYLPRADVAMDLLTPSPSRSVCPYKGEAGYFSAEVAGRRLEDLAWTYEAPFAEVALIRDRICFYPDRVDSIEIAAG